MFDETKVPEGQAQTVDDSFKAMNASLILVQATTASMEFWRRLPIAADEIVKEANEFLGIVEGLALKPSRRSIRAASANLRRVEALVFRLDLLFEEMRIRKFSVEQAVEAPIPQTAIPGYADVRGKLSEWLADFARTEALSTNVGQKYREMMRDLWRSISQVAAELQEERQRRFQNVIQVLGAIVGLSAVIEALSRLRII